MSRPFYHSAFKLGILGGGQLGRMFIQEATNLNVSVHILDPDPNAPCKVLAADFKVGDIKDYDTVMAFGADKDVMTIEIEHVNVDALEALEKQGVTVYPQPHILRMVQDKGLQKQFYVEHHIPTSPFRLFADRQALRTAKISYPIVQKMRKGGYDGKGVTILKSEADLDNAFDMPNLLEEMVDFQTEISVIVGRNANGEVKTYPVVDMEFNPEANLVEYLFAPSSIDGTLREKARKIAADLANALSFVGILAVEMFVTKSGDILVNEIAPRPHNSGHHTIEGNITSQYEQHLRAILNLPLGSTSLVRPSVMVNLLGEPGHTGEARYEGLEEVMAMEGTFIHLYGKKITKPFRKMGHVTITANALAEARATAMRVKETLKILT